MEFKERIKLNITTLDKAAIDQPTLYEEASTEWAKAMFARDQAKEKLKLAEASADMEIRKNPKKFGHTSDKSATEAWIAKQVILHPDVREASNEVIHVQYDVNILASGKEVLEHRKKSLDILTDLFKQNYFVARSRSDRDYVNALSKEGKEAQVEHMRKKK